MLGVVEDQEPASSLAERVGQYGQDLCLVGVIRHAEPAGKVEQLPRDGGRLLGRDPPSHVVGRSMPVGMFQSKLGLTNSAKSVQGHGLDDPGGRTGGESLREHGKLMVTAGKDQIARRQVRDYTSTSWPVLLRTADCQRRGDGERRRCLEVDIARMVDVKMSDQRLAVDLCRKRPYNRIIARLGDQGH